MISPDYARLMARYNQWQNDSLTAAAGTLDDQARRADRGAFFGSIEKTFSHLLWADRAWLGRFIQQPLASGGIRDSTALITDWPAFVEDRREMDQRILTWADQLTPDWLDDDLTWYSGAMGRELTRSRAEVVMQLFNHQTHHRGQIHAMLTAAGARPDDTDIPFMPDNRRS